MAKPIKFRIKKEIFKIENRCVICGRIIPGNRIFCESCWRRQQRIFRR